MLLLNEDAKSATNQKEKDPPTETLSRLTDSIQDSEAKTREEASYFSQEEIRKMPLLKEGHFRKTTDGYWQVRYRKDGYDIQFTAKDKNTVIDRYREWCITAKKKKKEKKPVIHKATTFGAFAKDYFKNVKAINVKPVTYDMQNRCLVNHILPALGEIKVKDLSPMNCQAFLNGLLEKGLGRTAEEAKILIKEILKAAVGEKIISENPMNYVKIPKYQQVHGKAFSKEEIAEFISKCQNSFYQKQFMLYLYTGIRRGEMQSVRFEDNFIIVANGKCRKGEKQQYRKIPIAPALKKYLPITKDALQKNGKVMSGVFKKIFPTHQLYDLRHTFTSRCIESGIPKELVDVWTGHVNRSDMTTAVYTHFSDSFMLKEILKLDY